jgi:hypothetical protein
MTITKTRPNRGQFVAFWKYDQGFFSVTLRHGLKGLEIYDRTSSWVPADPTQCPDLAESARDSLTYITNEPNLGTFQVDYEPEPCVESPSFPDITDICCGEGINAPDFGATGPTRYLTKIELAVLANRDDYDAPHDVEVFSGYRGEWIPATSFLPYFSYRTSTPDGFYCERSPQTTRSTTHA